MRCGQARDRTTPEVTSMLITKPITVQERGQAPIEKPSVGRFSAVASGVDRHYHACRSTVHPVG